MTTHPSPRDTVSECPRVILIGGAWSAGKSTTAIRVAHAIGLANVVHTDVLRACLRVTLSGDDRRCLSYSTYDAWRCQAAGSRGRSLAAGFLRQCHLLLPSIVRCLDEAVEYGKDTILEGMHLHPSILPGVVGDRASTYVWLTYPARAYELQVRRRCASTYRNRAATRYLESDRMAGIAALNELLLSDARACGATILDVTDIDPVQAICQMVSGSAT